jgi:hypothetical protein
MKTNTPKQAYEAPETSVDVLEVEQCFLESNLRDFDKKVIYEEDFEE